MMTTSWYLDTTNPLIEQHVVQGRPIPPLAYWLKASVNAVSDTQGRAPRELSQVLVRRPIVLEPGASIGVEFVGHVHDGGGRFELREQPVSGRSTHDGPIVEGAWANDTADDPTVPRRAGGRILDRAAFYDAAERAGFSYGPLLRRITAFGSSPDGWWGTLLPATNADDRLAAWDVLLQSAAVLAAGGGSECWLPFRVDRMRVGEGDTGDIESISGSWMQEASNGYRVANVAGFADGVATPRLALLGVHYRLVDRLRPEGTHVREESPAGTGRIDAAHVLERLREEPVAARRALLVRFIEDQLLEVLQWDASRRPELALGFVAIGLDSLMSVDLQFRLQTALNFALPIGESFDAPTVDELAESLLQSHLRFEQRTERR